MGISDPPEGRVAKLITEELKQDHFFCLLWATASHKTSPTLTSKEIELGGARTVKGIDTGKDGELEGISAITLP